MFVKYSLLWLVFKVLMVFTSHCSQKLDNITATNCVSGRRFFARFDHIPSLKNIFSKPVLRQLYTFPWTAQIISLYEGSSNICTGTLINDRYVITAPKCCLPPLKPQHIAVKLGYGEGFETSKFGKSPFVIHSSVMEIILYPTYQSFDLASLYNSIALLRIRPVVYTKSIYPIKLPEITDKYKEISNLNAEMAGYVSHKGYSFENVLVKELNNKECSSSSMFNKIENPEILCATVIEPTSTSCYITPGTPIIVEKPSVVYNVTVLVGVVTGINMNNKPCIVSESPVLNVRIANKLRWIFANTRDAIYCKE